MLGKGGGGPELFELLRSLLGRRVQVVNRLDTRPRTTEPAELLGGMGRRIGPLGAPELVNRRYRGLDILGRGSSPTELPELLGWCIRPPVTQELAKRWRRRVDSLGRRSRPTDLPELLRRCTGRLGPLELVKRRWGVDRVGTSAKTSERFNLLGRHIGSLGAPELGDLRGRGSRPTKLPELLEWCI